MPNKKRIWYPGAIYHITTRGNRKQDIFQDCEDYYVYLRILHKIQHRCGFILYSYCLMTNHIHLEMETVDVEIGIIMRFINLFYTKYFNNKYNLVGHLFQGRYKSELIESYPYILQASKYIHLNPVKANIVDNPIDYKFSSYDILMGKRESPLVDPHKILTYVEDSSTLYKKYVEGEVIMDIS